MQRFQVLVKGRRLVEGGAERGRVEVEDRAAHLPDIPEHGFHPPGQLLFGRLPIGVPRRRVRDRKSTRLNSSHTVISYAVFCLKKKNVPDARSGMPTNAQR